VGRLSKGQGGEVTVASRSSAEAVSIIFELKYGASRRRPTWKAASVPNPSSVIDGRVVVFPQKHVSSIYELTTEETAAVYPGLAI
jgi:hypothetical protein